MQLKVTSDATDPWEGSVDELMERQDLTTFVKEKIRRLQPGEKVSFGFETEFHVERTA